MTERQSQLIKNESPLTVDDAATREHYRERLREYLKDPAFRAIEGFPIGNDEAILAMSDPPYYTACPNPFFQDVLDQWIESSGQFNEKNLEAIDGAGVEPYVADVSEGKG